MRRSRAASRSTLVVLGASGALGLAMLPSSSALAVPVGGGAVDFAATGATQTYTVPASVCEVTISVEGAQGGHGALSSGNSGVTATGGGGGVGGNGTATVVVQPGQVLSVDVGVAGGDGTVNFGGGTQAAGGFGGGANAGVTYKSVGAGGGGGATSVRIGDTPLVIAGGGGGGGGGREAAAGGAGGNIGQSGNDGATAAGNGHGGGGGTDSAGGTGGQFGAPYYNNYDLDGSGASGGAGAGGAGASAAYYSQTFFGGAGGGGGLFGGGGGGAGNDYYTGGQSYNGGGGGGGGSGYIVPGALDVGTWAGHAGTGDGAATITPVKTCDASSVGFVGLSASERVGQALILLATSSAPGSISFSVEGTEVCSAVATIEVNGASTATCSWTPTSGGITHLGATFTPSDPMSYLASTAADVLTITDCARCVVTFDANGGSGRAASQVFKGVSQNLARNHYKWARHTFVGWAYTSGAVQADVENTANFQAWGDLTLYAVWIHNTSIITFDANGGSGRMAAQSVNTDAANLPSGTFTRSGKTFQGWSLKSSSKRATILDGANIDVPKNLTLYAIWR